MVVSRFCDEERREKTVKRKIHEIEKKKRKKNGKETLGNRPSI